MGRIPCGCYAFPLNITFQDGKSMSCSVLAVLGREVEPGALNMLDELLDWSPTPKDSNIKSKSNFALLLFSSI